MTQCNLILFKQINNKIKSFHQKGIWDHQREKKKGVKIMILVAPCNKIGLPYYIN